MAIREREQRRMVSRTRLLRRVARRALCSSERAICRGGASDDERRPRFADGGAVMYCASSAANAALIAAPAWSKIYNIKCITAIYISL